LFIIGALARWFGRTSPRRRLRPRFQDHVERGRHRLAELREAALRDDLADTLRTGLCTEPEGDLLIERRRQTDVGGACVVDASNWIEVFPQRVARGRFD